MGVLMGVNWLLWKLIETSPHLPTVFSEFFRVLGAPRRSRCAFAWLRMSTICCLILTFSAPQASSSTRCLFSGLIVPSEVWRGSIDGVGWLKGGANWRGGVWLARKVVGLRCWRSSAASVVLGSSSCLFRSSPSSSSPSPSLFPCS